MSGKLTWKINGKLSFSQTGLYEWWEYLNTFPSRVLPLEATSWYPGDIRLSGSELTWMLTPTTVMTARYSYFYMPSSHIGMGPQGTKVDITTPARFDSFTGVSSGNYFVPGGGSSVELPRRHGMDVKFNKYISGTRINHNVRFGVQYVDNYTNDHVVYSGGVRYTDVNGAPDQAEFRPPSSYRTPFQTYMMLRFSKSLKYNTNRLELIGEIRNLLDEISDANVTSTVFSSPNFGVPTAWAWPRRLYLGARYFFR